MIARVVALAARASLEPMLVRVGAFAAGFAALLLALPAGLPGPVVTALLLLAVLPAVAPRGPWTTVVVLATVGGWLADTGTSVVAGTGLAAQVPDPGRLLLLAGLLYVLHSLTALAATLPYDAVVTAEVLTRWLVRALAVVVVATALSVTVLVAVAELASGRTYAVAPLAGLVVAVAIAATLRLRRS